MLEKLPEAIGHALSGVRAGLDDIVFNTAGLRAGHGTLELTSLAFGDHAPIPSATPPTARACHRRWRGQASRLARQSWC